MIKPLHRPVSARDLRHAFTCWMDAPLDNHKLNRLQSLQQHWELKARIEKLTTAKPPMHAGATA